MKLFLSFLLVVVFGTTQVFSQLNRADFTPRNVETYAFTQKNLQEGPLVVDSVASILDAINILFGPGVAVSNLSYSGPLTSIGSFQDTTTVYASAGDFGIDYGLLMTTGSIYDAPGPNSSSGISGVNNLPGDADLNALIPGYYSYDASVIEFDFTPMTDTLIACKFVFASEEYLEWVNSSFNDVFGFFISGPGFIGLQNLATIQTYNSAGVSTEVPISVNSINDLTNSQYFVLNEGSVTEYDGFTTPIELMHTITPGQTYHFKIAVADAGDMILDAAVFLEAGSFLGYASVPVSGYTFAVNGMQVSFTNTTNYATSYLWNFGDGNFSTEASPIHEYELAGSYEVELEARNYYQLHTTTHTVVIPEVINGIGIQGTPAVVSDLGDGKLIRTEKECEFKLYDMNGKIIMMKKGKELYLMNKTAGIYFLKINDDNIIYSIKIIL